MEKELVFFKTGEVVRLKQSIEPKPDMIIKKIIKGRLTNDGEKVLLGIKCFWFNDNKDYCEQIFSSKDLEKVC